MPNVKLGVSADFGGVTSGMASVGQEAAKLGATLQRGMTYKPFDLKAVERDLKRYEQLVRDMQKRIDALTRAPGGAGGLPAPAPAPSLLPALLPPAPPQPSPFLRSRTPRGRHAYTFSPDVTDIGRSLMGGFGGGVGTISQYATRGAIAGSREQEGGGGMLGGGMGLLRGGLIGAGVLGAMKIGQGVSEGYDMAKERGSSLDELKRQMGDLGISFNQLTRMSELSADGLNINSKEAAKLAQEFNQLSRGAEKTPEGLAGAVRTGAGMSMAYGIQPSAGVNFLGGMRQIDPKQNNRELALMLAEAIGKSGMAGNAGEVLQAIQSLSSTTARLSLSIPNISGFAGAYGALMGAGTPGMTSGVATNILGQANSAVQTMGGVGEASQNFTHAAFQRYGALSPVSSMALAQGGMYGSRASVFGKDGPLAQYYKGQGVDVSGMTKGAGANVTNYQAIKEHFDRIGGDPDLKLQGFQRYMKLDSLSNAAALYNMNREQSGGLQKALGRAGVDINAINPAGLQTLSKVGAAKSKDDLTGIYGEMGKRTGKGALTDQDKKDWAGAQGGSLEKMQEALLKIASTKDREETTASKTIAGLKAIETAQTSVGAELIKPLNTMRDAMLSLVGGGKKTAKQVITDMANLQYNEDAAPLKSQRAEIQKKLDVMINPNKMTAETKAAVLVDKAKDRAEVAAIDAQIAERAKQRDDYIKAQTAVVLDGSSGRTAVPVPAAVAGKPAVSTKDAQIMQESGGRHRNADGSLVRSSKGALGITQVMPSSGANPGYGIEPLQGDSPEAYIRYRDSYMGVATKRYGGDRQKALASYNGGIDRTDKAIAKYGDDWLSHMPKETRDYATNIMSAENGTTPMPKQSSQAKQAATDTVHVIVTTENKMIAPDGRTISTKTATATAPLPRGTGTRSISVDAS